MGIFSRRPKIPEPTITCAYSTTGTYHPSSPLSGTIAFICAHQRQIRNITLTFYGHCVTHATRQESTGGPNGQTRTIHYHDDVDLFRYVQDLTPAGGAFMAPFDEQMSFAFDFAFPAATQVARYDPYEKATAGSVAYDVGQHELPPSYGLGYGSSKVATVEYRVEAAFLMDDNPEPFIVRFDPLPFTPYPPTMPAGYTPPFIEYVREPEKYSSSRLLGQEKSFRASIRDKFSSKTASCQVTMKASLVPIVTAGAAFELFLCLELARLSDPGAIDIPTVCWTVKKLKLYDHAQFRALRQTSGHSIPELERTDEKDTVLNAIPELQFAEKQVPPPAYLDAKAGAPIDAKGRPSSSSTSSSSSSNSSGDSWKIAGTPQLTFPTSFSARIPSDVVPSFRTVNINHHFQLEVEVEVEIAEKEFEHQFCVESLTVLPAPV